MRSAARKPCFAFARGNCSYGAKCKFLHDANTSPPKGSHASDSGTASASATSHAPRPAGQPLPSELRNWIRMIPESATTAGPLEWKLPKFFQSLWTLISNEDVASRQQVIKKLASEGGLLRIKELTDTQVAGPLSAHQASPFKDSVVPLFRAISHESVLCSLLLETEVDTIYNFLFGPSGRRAVTLFTFVSQSLQSIVAGENGSTDFVALEASLAVLRKIIELNGTAQILEEFHPVVQTISACLEGIPIVGYTALLHRAQQSLGRIQQRLNLGSEIPHSQPVRKQEKQPAAAYKMVVELPGALSDKGPRHDNDHADITNIRILPTAQEIQSPRPEYLPVRDPLSWHRPGIHGLLDRQFRLLREDTVGQLRDAVGEEIRRLSQPQGGSGASRASARGKQATRTVTFDDARILDVELDQRRGIQIVVRFNQPPACHKLTAAQRREWWANSKRLQQDALLCLCDSQNGAKFLSVCDHGKPNGPAPQELTRNLFSNPLHAVVHLSLVDAHVGDLAQIITFYKQQKPPKMSLVEFPGILLPSFYPTLQAIQEMSRHGNVPFAEYLLPASGSGGEAYIPPPAYALPLNFQFELGSLLTNKTRLALSPHEQFDIEALQKSSTFDDAQAVALVNALCRRLALIQGPPGTGKSYTGIAIIKALLQNRARARLGPILCICYTNHALDQLLEHLVTGGVKQIVRLGSRSKSTLLEPCNLRVIAQGQVKTRPEKHDEWQLLCGLDETASELEAELSELRNCGSWKGIKKYLEDNHVRHHNELFGVEEEGFQTVRHDKTKVISNWLMGITSPKSYQRQRTRVYQVLMRTNVHDMSRPERHSLHQHWLADITRQARENLCASFQAYTATKTKLSQCRQEVDLRCLQAAHVIGATTTGLARNLKLLQRVPAKVLVCEEAGEVLEAHTVTALLPHVEHAVLIGDHQQLRPHIQNYELQHDNPRGERYSLDVSLFERLVDPKPAAGSAPNDQIPCSVLDIQRRMHPSIAQLVRDTLYPRLQDHPSVQGYPEVWGLAKRLFWLDHRELEAGAESPESMSVSHSNAWEVEMTASLVSHLVRQCKYKSDDIAILTPYLGQLQKLRRRMSMSHEIVIDDRDAAELEKEGLDADPDDTGEKPSGPQKMTLLKTLRIATVDNFQGEEAKVVIVSLVRSNPRNVCGFLKTPNRINVLLSRAQHGMYIIGNAQTSRHVPMWANVLSILEANNNVGRKLPLRCSRHPEVDIEVSSPDDFSILAPEGGCNKKCGLRLSCGHACSNRCHSELLHNAVVCPEPCPRSKPDCDHSCPRLCGQECERPCRTPVADVQLPCGHVRAYVECHKMRHLAAVKCERLVERTVPGCQHTVTLRCYVDETAEQFQCHAPCGALLPCGHACQRKCRDCNVRRDGAVVERNHGACLSTCGRPYNNCAHQCRRTCHGDEPCPLCDAACDVRCHHSRCSKKCSEPCAPCAQPCSWSCPHRGRCRMPCAVPCNILPCSERCGQVLGCGHRCPSVCGENCPPTAFCQVCASDGVKDMVVDYIMSETYKDLDLDADPVVVPACGHLMSLSSMDGHMGMRTFYETSSTTGAIEALKALPEPFSEENLKSCPMCRGPLRDINRYNRIVRQGLMEQATRKFVSWANQHFIPLEARLHGEERALQQSFETELALFQGPAAQKKSSGSHQLGKPIRLEKSPAYQVDAIRRFADLKARYKAISALRVEITVFLRSVGEQEQPFGRVWDMVQDIRRRQGSETAADAAASAAAGASAAGASGSSFELNHFHSVLNTRFRMLATLLLIRCDVAVVSDFYALQRRGRAKSVQHDWVTAELHADFADNRQACERVVDEARQRQQPMQEVEARIFFARWAALERAAASSLSSSSSPTAATATNDLAQSVRLLDAAKEHLRAAEEVCKRWRAQTPGMLAEVEAASAMLRRDGDVFYTAVDNDEKRQVYAAMAREFLGTGHWYTCANGHPFTVGECGMPMETAACPQCGAQIGGQHHQAVEGVRHARDFEEQFGRLRI